MTVIVAAHTTEGITVAADTQTTDGSMKMFGVESKVRTVGPYVVGTAGSKRVGQVIRYGTQWPALPDVAPADPEAVTRWLVAVVVPAVQQACRAAGVLTEDDGVLHFDAMALVVVAGCIAEIDGDGCVHIDRSGRWAIGSGGLIALGALGDGGRWTARQVQDAAMLATRIDLGCGGGVDVFHIPAEPDLPPVEAPPAA